MSISERLIRHFSEEGATVVIPFAGSGSECVAAAMNGRHFLASELKLEYVQLGNSRVQEALTGGVTSKG
jgi:DNA modification methylase